MNRVAAFGIASLMVACSTAERRLTVDAAENGTVIDAPPGTGGGTDGGTDAATGSTDASTAPATCGNGTMNNGEACDDSNIANNDGCSSACTLEATQAVTLTALNTTVTDDAYNGSLASMTCVNVAVTAWYTPTIAGTTVTFGMDHAWIGDLTIKLVAPDNTLVTLVSRPGVIEAADDGTGSPGSLSMMAKGYPITFAPAAATSAEAMGGVTTVCQSNNVCSFIPNNGAAAAGTLAAFNGKPSTGTWKLCVGDSTGGDVGKIDRVTLTFTH